MVESALTGPPLACRSSRDEQRRYGLDLTGGKGRLAGCSLAGGQGIVDCLTEIDLEQREPNDIEPTGDFHFSIPENEAIIKRVKIPVDQTLDGHKLALFEFQSSLLSQADQYYLETYSLDGKPERLAVAYNRALVDQKLSFLTAKIRKPTGFRLRSLALAAGFFHYCQPVGGEALCLLDINHYLVSYCFMHGKYPVMAGSVNGQYLDPGQRANSLLDLRAILQYQMAMLFNTGYSTPLSFIVVAGSVADEGYADLIAENMKVKAGLPIFRPDCFRPNIISLAAKYFVSLGLTVDI